MCWSPGVSAATSMLVAVVVGVLYQRNRQNDRWNAIFLGVFGSMQVVDYMLWYEDDINACSETNQVITRIGACVILLEPLASLVGMALFIQRQRRVVAMECCFYGSLAIVTLMFYTRGERLCTSLSRGGHLVYFSHPTYGGSWCDGGTEIPMFLRVLYLVGMAYPYVYMKPQWLSRLHILILSCTWLIGVTSDAHASVWCLANVAQAFVMVAF